MNNEQLRVGIYCKGNKYESANVQKNYCLRKCEDLRFRLENVDIYEEIDEITIRKANQFLKHSGLNGSLGRYDGLKKLVLDIKRGQVNIVMTSHEDIILYGFKNARVLAKLFQKYNVKYISFGLEMDIKLMNKGHLAITEPMISKIMTAEN